jgi:hypothetical protein
MSLSQTYHVASTARAKLGREACRADHNLRRLVGHANLLDALTLELRDAEREQEAWFNASVKRAQEESKQSRKGHIQWADTIVEEEEVVEDSDDSDDDSDSEYDEEEFHAIPLRRIRQPAVVVSSSERTFDEEQEEDEEEEEYEDVDDTPELALTRTYSHPPELVDDSDSDDDSPPASPPQPTFDFDAKSAAEAGILELGGGKMLRTGYILRAQNPPMIESY